MIRHPMGENSISWLFHSPLILPRVHITFAKIKCGRGLARDLTSLQDSQTTYYERTSFLTNAPNDQFRKNVVQENRMAKFDITVSQMPHVFSDSPGIYLYNYNMTQQGRKQRGANTAMPWEANNA